MYKLKQWLKRLLCFITGGHTYADINLQSCCDEANMMVRYRNRCCKCGKAEEWEIPMENILPKRVRPSTYVYVPDEED
jgi:hypothetical protein